MPHSFHSFRFWGRPQLSRLISPYLDSTSPGWSVRGVEEGRGEEPHQGGFSEIKPLFKTRRPRAPGMQAGARGFPVAGLAAWGRVCWAKGQVSRDVLAVLPLSRARANTFSAQGEPQRPAGGLATGLHLPPLVLLPRNLGKTQKEKVAREPPPWKGTRITPEGPCFAFPLGLLGADISWP